MASSLIIKLIAWGQYVHWCELQFGQYSRLSENTPEAEVVGVTAHWFAALRVVLEGWKELGHKDPKIDKLLSLYPENEDVLRRCRNAVYHFQDQIMDRRIVNMLSDTNEAFTWSLALHFEFQRYLVDYPHGLSSNREENELLAAEMAACIGWWPDSSHRAHVQRICDVIHCLVSADTTEEVRDLAVSSGVKLAAIDTEPFTSKLSRYRADDL